MKTTHYIISLLLLMCLASCNKEKAESNKLIGKWILDHVEYTTTTGGVIQDKFDNCDIVLVFSENSAIYQVISLDGGNTSDEEIPFTYQYADGVLFYNSLFVDLSYSGEFAKVEKLTSTEMRILYREDSTPWVCKIENYGQPNEKVYEATKEVDVYKRIL